MFEKFLDKKWIQEYNLEGKLFDYQIIWKANNKKQQNKELRGKNHVRKNETDYRRAA